MFNNLIIRILLLIMLLIIINNKVYNNVNVNKYLNNSKNTNAVYAVNYINKILYNNMWKINKIGNN